MPEVNKAKIARAYILMFISPPISLISSIKGLSTNHRKWLIIIAGTIMGSTFLFDEIGDGIRHYEMVETFYAQLSFAEFVDMTWRMLTLQRVEYVRGDLYIHFISYLSGAVLMFPQLFWIIVSFVYSYFYVSSIFILYYLYPIENKTKLFVSVFVFLVALKSFDALQTVRTWTAFWILFYGYLKYELTKEKFYLFLVFIFPPLIHFGFLALALPTWVLTFIDTNKKIIKYSISVVFIASFFISVDHSFILDIASGSELTQTRSESYYLADAGNRKLLNLEYLGKSNFYAALHNAGFTFFFIIVIAVTFLIYKNYYNMFNKVEAKLFSAGLLTQSLSNVTMFLFAVSNRTAWIAVVYFMSAISLYIRRTHFDKINTQLNSLQLYIIYLCLFGLSTFLLYITADLMQWLSVYFLGFPLIPILFEDANMTARQFLGPVFEPLFR